MGEELARRREALVGLTKRDPDARVRHRAHALLALIDGPTAAAVGARLGVSAKTLGRWRARFLAEGGAGLRDRPRRGRPAKLPEAARALLAEALEADPGAYGYPVATWTIADLTDLLERRGWPASVATVQRAVHALGYVHRRPRHDLRHRQDAEAVASATRVLGELQKRGLLPTASACSTSTSASSTPTPTWRRSGSGAAPPAGSPPPGPTGG